MAATPWHPVELIKTTAAYLEEKGVPSARLDAELLLAEVLGCRRIDLYVRFEQPLTPEEVDAYRDLVRRRAGREPVSRILGVREFMSHRFKVTPEVLSPRPETEILVEEALRLLEAMGSAEEPPGLLDLGTGSGCIAVSVAARRPEVQMVATDLSAPALLVARDNAHAAGVWQRIDFREGDLFDACWPDETFDMILCNPPYLAEGDPAIWPEVSRYDPPRALYGGETGLDFYPRLAVEGAERLRPGGCLLLEVGAGQAGTVMAMLNDVDALESVRSLTDHAGVERVVTARRTLLRAGRS